MTCVLFPHCGHSTEGDGKACMTKVANSVGRAKLSEMLLEIEKLADFKKFNKLLIWKPYPGQKTFFENGLTFKERLLLAGNRAGKTEAGAYEMACHLTGRYPDWWTGKKFDHPIKALAAGLTAEATREAPQEKLYGPPGVEDSKGSGFIPKVDIKDVSSTRGITDTVDTMQIRHYTDGVFDGISTLRFMSYEKGVSKFQGFACDVIWLDEDMEKADQVIYSECCARLEPEGILYMTFTATKGPSIAYRRFTEPDKLTGAIPPQCRATFLNYLESTHMTPEQWRAKMMSYPPHEREMRMNGTPMRGDSRVYDTIGFDQISIPAMQVLPMHWPKIAAIDLGYNNFAYVLGMWDREADVVYILDAWIMQNKIPTMHAAKIKSQAIAVPIAWPQDGDQHDKQGNQTKSLYKKEGLRMLETHARYLGDDGNSVEAGITDLLTRMQTGKLRVASHLVEFRREFNDYYRKDGKIVKTEDHIMDALRYLIMSLRFAQCVPLGSKPLQPLYRENGVCKGVDDWDVNP